MSSPKKAPQTPIQDKDMAAPLNKGEVLHLSRLGWKTDDVRPMPVSQARSLITNRTYKPGSAAYIKNQEKLLQKAGLSKPDISRISDEGIAARNATKDEPSGIDVRLDEYTQRTIRGDNPIDAALIELENAMPGMRIRAINPDLPPSAGPMWQQCYDKKGNAIQVAGLNLSFMPETVYDEHYRKPNYERSRQMTGAISSNAEDAGLALKPEDRKLAPVAQTIHGPDGQLHKTGELETAMAPGNYA
jgi:hypothetical protein